MNILRFLHTVRHLKLIQIFYQLKYRLIKPRVFSHYNSPVISQQVKFPVFSEHPPVQRSFLGHNTFSFLNQTRSFGPVIDWNYQGYGKLWNYHLQYASFLLQPNLGNDEKLQLVQSLYTSLNKNQLPLEPYPVSLRAMNVMRWLSLKQDPDPDPGILAALHAELDFLSGHLEYHLLGNHLLENGFALLMGGYFFSNKAWTNKVKKLLKRQLSVQILADGGHFELSPSYHSIVFFRLLELIDWLRHAGHAEDSFLTFLGKKAGCMLAWLQQMRFTNGDLPPFGDSVEGAALPTAWLLDFAAQLNIKATAVSPGASGYRVIARGNYECRVDVGQLGPPCQPGHAHADALSFLLYHHNQPLMVEMGTSTYQPGVIRERERSTAAHNTVVVNGRSQSQMWGAFRVSRRAKATLLEESPDKIRAMHNGYRALKLAHRRTFKFKEREISISDEVVGEGNFPAVFHLHFYPGISPVIDGQRLIVNKKVHLYFSKYNSIKISDYEMATGFNQYQTAKKLEIDFKEILVTLIEFLA